MAFHINISLYKLLSLSLLNSLKLIVCFYVKLANWYLLGVKLSLSHIQIGTNLLGIQLKFPSKNICPFYVGVPLQDQFFLVFFAVLKCSALLVVDQ